MPIYHLKLIDRKVVAHDTNLFTFEKPEGFTFIPGQYAGFTLIESQEIDTGGITRRFSILSIPNDPFIAIATRTQKSAYKRVLNALPIGNKIKLAGPTGKFTLHDEEMNVPAVLIAGGIGITPFYSMIRHATEIRSSQKIILFYGNQQISDAAFLSELVNLSKTNPNFTLVSTMAVPDESWQGETGFINDAMLVKYIADLATPIYYICGSPMMVTKLRQTLREMKIEEEKIRVEDFPGY